MLTPEERKLRSRLGAHAMHAKHDSHDTTAAARLAAAARFEREVDPDGVLPEEERKRRAEHAQLAHMARIAFESARKRRAKVAAKAAPP